MPKRTMIQVDRDTKILLDMVKKETGARSYSEAIRLLSRNAKKIEESEADSLPKLGTFRRDKHDRFD